MPHLYRDNINIADLEGIKGYRIEIEIGNTGIFFIGKGVSKFPLQRLFGKGICIDLHFFSTKKIESPYIIKARNMVFVRMCEKDRIHVLYFFPQHLAAEIRRCVNNDRC